MYQYHMFFLCALVVCTNTTQIVLHQHDVVSPVYIITCLAFAFTFTFKVLLECLSRKPALNTELPLQEGYERPSMGEVMWSLEQATRFQECVENKMKDIVSDYEENVEGIIEMSAIIGRTSGVIEDAIASSSISKSFEFCVPVNFFSE